MWIDRTFLQCQNCVIVILFMVVCTLTLSFKTKPQKGSKSANIQNYSLLYVHNRRKVEAVGVLQETD